MTDITIRNGDLRLAASVHGSVDAPNILCLHGISSSHDTWEETVRRLEDPPMYHGEQSEWDKGIFSTVFPILRDKEIELQTAGAGLDAYIEFASNLPAPQGGVLGDHISGRHLICRGSSWQRHDPATWGPALDLTMFATFDPSLTMRVPATVIQADNALGAAFMEGHEQRLIATNPTAEVVLYEGATHFTHGTRATEPRFLDHVDAFITRHVER